VRHTPPALIPGATPPQPRTPPHRVRVTTGPRGDRPRRERGRRRSRPACGTRAARAGSAGRAGRGPAGRGDAPGRSAPSGGAGSGSPDHCTARPGGPRGGVPGPGPAGDRVASALVRSGRQCSRSACGRPAVATLTYVYQDSTAVLGPLAQLAEPHSYDLCAEHASRLTAPRGWEVVRLSPQFVETGPSDDDLSALADAVREARSEERRGGEEAISGCGSDQS